MPLASSLTLCSDTLQSVSLRNQQTLSIYVLIGPREGE